MVLLCCQPPLKGYKLTSAQIERDHVYVAEEHATVLGFYSLIAYSPNPELDLLLVSDTSQGFGIGVIGEIDGLAA